jgi:pimeloyl-ACP methyl ester carboxylesterase
MTRRRAASAIGALSVIAALAACGNAQDVARSAPASSSNGATSTSPSTDSPMSPSPTTPPGRPLAGFGAGPPGSGLARFTRQEIDWESCDTDQCARVWVPLDYRKPDATAISLVLRKKPAAGTKRGTLFINPGGPGVSALPYVDDIPFASSVRDAYDIVGVDPRGVGQSTPVDCVSDRELDAYIASDPSPDTTAEIRQGEIIWQRFTDGCLRRSGPLLKHMSTVEVAKDFDLLRQLVGDRKLNYLGFSYGTYIGATYAGEFPRNVGRMVLDGAINPLESPAGAEVGATKGFEVALDAFLEDCVANNCPLGNSVDGIKQRIQRLFKTLDAKPLVVGSRELTEGEALIGLWFPLYSKNFWPLGRVALQAAFAGDGSRLLVLADQYAERKPDGTYVGNSGEAQPAVNCLDHPEHATVADILSSRDKFLAASKTFGPSAMWFAYACSHWPANAEFKKPDFHAKGSAPIVVIGTTRDPATPYRNSVALAQLLDSGVLLSRDGDGHTAYVSGNSCIDDTVNAFLVNGAVPPNGKKC